MYRIETETFLLEFDPKIYEEDFAYPVNVSLWVRILSYGYSAETYLDVSVKGIAGFATDLKNLYEELTGEARLEEPYNTNNYIEFTAKTGGHIEVTGRLNNKGAFGYTQEVYFENEFDQTYLRSFVINLFDDFSKYDE